MKLTDEITANVKGSGYDMDNEEFSLETLEFYPTDPAANAAGWGGYDMDNEDPEETETSTWKVNADSEISNNFKVSEMIQTSISVEDPVQPELGFKLIAESIDQEEIPSKNNKEVRGKFQHSPCMLADIILDSGQIFAMLDDQLSYYYSDYGYFQYLELESQDELIRKISPKYYHNIINSNYISETIKWIRTKCIKISEMQAYKRHKYKINFKNVSYNILTERYEEHNYENYFQNYTDCDYPMRAFYKEDSEFLKFIDTLSKGDPSVAQLLIEVLGVLISNYRDMKKIIVALGDKDTGKSKFLEFARALLNHKFCSSMSLSYLAESPFNRSELYQKTANICAEVDNSTIKNSADLKSYSSGGDLISAAFKFGNIFQFVVRALFCLACNELPKIVQDAKYIALVDRFQIIPFLNQLEPSEQDPDILEKLLNESSFVAWYCIKYGLTPFIKRGGHFCECSASQKIKDEYLNAKNSFNEFLAKNASFGPKNTHWAYTYQIQDLYDSFCYDSGLSTIEEKDWKEIMGKDKRVTYDRINRSGENRYGYKGIRIMDSNIGNTADGEQ